MIGPCVWPISYASCPDPFRGDEGLRLNLDPISPAPDETDPEAPGDGTSAPAALATQVDFERMAVEYLWNWTGRRFGLCEASVRPCLTPVRAQSTFTGRGPYGRLPGGRPALTPRARSSADPFICGGCGSSACSCGSPYAVSIPGPVDSIVEVRLDGEVLDPAAYRVDGHRWLVRLDGEPWPATQDLLAEEGPGTGSFAVDYLRGLEVPTGGQIAAGLLANELWKAACGAADCALPQRVQTVTRQGVSVAVLDAFEDVAEGRTGIWAIDSWIASVTRPPSGGRVVSVDVTPSARPTQTWPR